MSSSERERQIAKPDAKRLRKQGFKQYERYLKGEIKQGAPGVEAYYRNQAFRDIGNTQQQANMGVDRALAGSFGINAPTGLKAALYAQNTLRSDYGGANLMATRMQQQRMRELGTELAGLQQKKANVYATRANPYIQWMLGLGQLEANQAAVSAQMAAAAE